MHLKSLTLRGFKSFASSTTLRFEPGITCVVGPNGSGKSNVVDALAWVMGEQGAKSLRGGKMEDVIFAGTAGRQALGRAEVVLTIDNTDGALPIEYSEVTISRTMFRSGGSEYAINGQSCRLLDVQELLSDSGIGREMHVVVGQGQLDAVLAATPEERRGFIEEAAGVLKHRKRKEKALRKLEAMQANLARVQDLTAELRRQLGPLGKQAELARKAATIQSDLRDSRLRLLADDLVQARASFEQETADETALRARQAEAGKALEAARVAESQLDSQLQESAPQLAAAQETWYRLSSLRERVRSTASLAEERARHLATVDDTPRIDRDPEDLEQEAATVRKQERELAEQIEKARGTLSDAVERRSAAEKAAEDEDRRVKELTRARADHREGLARLSEKVEGMRRRAASAESEIGRLTKAREEAIRRADEAEHEFTALETTVAGLSVGEAGLTEEHEKAAAALAEADEVLAELKQQLSDVERERAATSARHEALSMSLTRKDGAEALLAATDRIPGVMGSVAALLSIEMGWEAAVATALGASSDAVAVATIDDAVESLRMLHDDDAGRAGLLVGGTDVTEDGRTSWPSLPSGMRYLFDLIQAPEQLRGALVKVLRGVVAVDDLPAARALVAEMPTVVAVTRAGDMLGSSQAYGGSSSAPSLLEIQASVDEAEARLADAAKRADELTKRVEEAAQVRETAAAAEAAALSKLHESDAELAAVTEKLAGLGGEARSSRGEAERLETAVAEAEAARDRDLSGLAELEERLAAAQDAGSDVEEVSTDERDRLAALVNTERQAEMEARLALRTSEERVRALSGRAESLERAAREARQEQERARRMAEQRARHAVVASSVARGAAAVIERLDRSITIAAEEKAAVEQARSDQEAELSRVREQVRALAAELDEITSTVHRDELARAEHRLRVEALETKALEELGVDAQTLVDEYGPHVLIPMPPDDDDQPRDPIPYVRDEQEKRCRSAEKQLAKLGKVNPLALEEYAALEERHSFLTEQLEDLKRTRKDLLDIVKEVDDKVQQAFTEAFDDTAREFAEVFGRLFPGGEGRLVLTDPDDVLTTGVDVEARPPGKKVKRLSLLSGGERSLVAVGFLVALFKARPSPFYILDEVEAALDDTNLDRLLNLFEELRQASQLIVITHQKSTMEIADALYGVSMRGDGVTTVISQRLRETEPA